MVGSVVIFTQNGFPFAPKRSSWIAVRRASAFGWDKAVMLPRPPARDTAAARGGTPTLDIASNTDRFENYS